MNTEERKKEKDRQEQIAVALNDEEQQETVIRELIEAKDISLDSKVYLIMGLVNRDY